MTAPGESNDAAGRVEDPGPSDRASGDLRSPDLGGRDRSMDPDDMTIEDIAEAEAARPDLPDETEDGLSDLEEDVRRQAEDLPIDAPGRD